MDQERCLDQGAKRKRWLDLGCAGLTPKLLSPPNPYHLCWPYGQCWSGVACNVEHCARERERERDREPMVSIEYTVKHLQEGPKRHKSYTQKT